MAHVTIPDTSPRVQYQVSGSSTTDFVIPYAYFDETDILVYVDGTLKTLGELQDYTITGDYVDPDETDASLGFTGGTVVLNSGVTNAVVTIVRDVPVKRETDFNISGPFNITALNTELDKVTAQIQQQEQANQYHLRVDQFDQYTDLTIPVKDDRKGKVLAFDSTTGDPIAGPDSSDVQDLFDNINADLYVRNSGDTLDGDLTITGNLTVEGTTTSIDSASVQTVDLGDGDKIRLGDDNDLQIYHDSTENIIEGDLRLQADTVEIKGDAIDVNGTDRYFPYLSISNIHSSGATDSTYIKEGNGYALSIEAFRHHFYTTYPSVVKGLTVDFDNAVIFYDKNGVEGARFNAENNEQRLGIGTSNPAAPLEIQSDSSLEGAYTAALFTHYGSTGDDDNIQLKFGLTNPSSTLRLPLITAKKSNEWTTTTSTQDGVLTLSAITDGAAVDMLEVNGTGIDVSGTITATGYNNTNWDTAYGWGDHSTAGYLTSYTVSESDVTQHQAALSITESQISDLQSYLTSYTVTEADVTAHQAALSITESQISDLQSYLTSYTETNDLSSAVTWANVPDANITESSVTQHQTALSITESQISDLQDYVLTTGDTMTGDLLFNTDVESSYNDVLKIYESGGKGYIISPSGTSSHVNSDDLRVATGSSAWGDGGDLELAAGLTLDSNSSGGAIRLNAGNYYQQGGSDYSWGAHITMGGASATRTGSISISAGEADEGTDSVDAGDVNITAGRTIGAGEGGRINFNVYNSTGKVIGEGGDATPAGYFDQTGQLNLREGLSVTGNGSVSGNLTVTGNLQVDGTTTTVNSTTLDVADLNITVASGAANAAAADGAGLTVDGASATITYNSTDDDWEFNKGLDVIGTVNADGLALGDNQKAQFGAGNDLQIYHYNNQNFINSANNMGLYFYNDLVSFNSEDGTYETLALDNANNKIVVYTNMEFGDNDKAIFGAGSDLQIYHDGSNSYITDAGTGHLRLQGTNLRLEDSDGYAFIICSDTGAGGEVSLQHEGSEKLATTSTGVDVTGTVTADGLTIDGVSKSTANTVTASTASTDIDMTASNFHVVTMNASTTFNLTNLSDAVTTSGTIIIKQDATGGRSFTLPSSCKTPVGGATIVQSTGANETSILSYIVVSSSEVLVNYVGDFA